METKTVLLQQWKSRVERTKRLREEWETRFKVKELELAYLGLEAMEDTAPERKHFNHFFSTVQTQKPALLPKSTAFAVSPKRGKKPFGTLESNLQEAVLDAISKQDDNLFNDAALALSQAFFRLGVLKVVYNPVFEPNPQGEDEGEPDEVLTDEVYVFEWVDARRMLLPDEGPNMRKWTWIGEEIETTLGEAKQDPRFSHRRQLQANAWDASREVGREETEEEGDRASFCYYEVWDIVNKRLYAWADGQTFDDFLIDEEYPDGIEDHPYSILAFLPIQGPEPSPWPKPVTFDWLSIQEDYDILREQMVNAAKRAARKFLFEQQTFPDEEELDKFVSPADMQGVQVTDLNRPPQMFGEASQNPDVSRNIPFLFNDWRIITGASGVRLGDPDADTATEAMLIEQSSTMRENAARAVVDTWLARAGKKMLQLVRQTLTMDIWVQLRGFSDSEFKEFIQRPAVQTMLAMQVGQENVAPFLAALELNPQLQQYFKERFGNIKPLRITRSELQFESDVTVLPSASRPLQQAQLLRLAQVLGPLAFMSPTFLEELLASFDLPQGDRIAEEILIQVKQFQQQQGQMAQTGRPAGGPPPNRLGPMAGLTNGRGGL